MNERNIQISGPLETPSASDTAAAGRQLRLIRESLGLTVRDVEAATALLAQARLNPEYAIVISQISDIETKGRIPSIYRLHALSIVYRRDIRDLLFLYCNAVDQDAADLRVVKPSRTHLSTVLDATQQLEIPTRLDPKFNPTSTMNLERMIEQWGPVPFVYLKSLVNTSYTYGFVGAQDYRMYPLIVPGTFLQIDQSKTEIESGPWRSEFERPIYWLETREEYLFGWCSQDEKGWITVHAHPLSGVPARKLRHPQEAEIVGQIVGIAMRLDVRHSAASSEAPLQRK